MSKIAGNSRRRGHNIYGPDGCYIGVRHVMYDAGRGVYVYMTGRGETPDRFWAWSGTPAQARNARKMFGISDRFVTVEDGRERG